MVYFHYNNFHGNFCIFFYFFLLEHAFIKIIYLATFAFNLLVLSFSNEPVILDLSK